MRPPRFEARAAEDAGARRGVGLAVVALHALLLWAWQDPPRPAAQASAGPLPAPIHLIWLRAPAAGLPAAVDAPQVGARWVAPGSGMRAVPARAASPSAAEPGGPGKAQPPSALVDPSDHGEGGTAPWLSPLPPPSAASAAGAAPGRLLDSAASRQAIRDAARGPLLAERAASATGIEPESAAEKLSKAAAAAGMGDCLKGEYGGGGMGLLSLPFLALAAARGRCAR